MEFGCRVLQLSKRLPPHFARAGIILPLYPFFSNGVFHIGGILGRIFLSEFSRSKTPKFPARFTAVNEYLAFTPAGETVPIVTVCRPCQPSLAWRVRFATPRDFIKCLRRQAAPTEPVNLIASTLASHPAAIEEVSGLEVRLDLAREWTRSLAHTNIFGPWSVKVVNQLGRCSKDAQDMLLAYLDHDRMKAAFADFLQQLVAADDAARSFAGGWRFRRDNGVREEIARAVVGGQQGRHPLAQVGVALAGGFQIGGAGFRGVYAGRLREDFLQSFVIGFHRRGGLGWKRTKRAPLPQSAILFAWS